MQLHRSIILGGLSLLFLSACGSSSQSSSYGTPSAPVSGTGTPQGGVPNPGFGSGSSSTKGTFDSIVATVSSGAVAVEVGSSTTLSVTFTSIDGQPISGFAISGSLTMLPAGWTGPANFSCALVSNASTCVLNLTYTPTVVGTGTVVLNYLYVDNANLPSTPGTSVSIPFTATAQDKDNVIATVSPTGQVAVVAGTDNATVSVNFTTDDGNAATNLSISTDLTALPGGWQSTVTNFSCPIVSTGSGCQLPLTFASTTPLRGTLTLTFAYTDDSGAAKTGVVNIPYTAATSNDVVASASPTGQVTAIQKTGGVPVPVTFNTDNGKAASALYLTSDLTTLPPGWSAASKSFSCSSVSTGNGCQLGLKYAPTALASGVLTLTYAYTDSAGTAKTGLFDVAYAATTNDNVVATPSPSGQINAVVGLPSEASEIVTVTFATDDARPATALSLTTNLSALPAGWSSSVSSFTCSGLNSDNVCQVPFTYAPLVTGSGMLTLTYTYMNNADETKTGSLNIPYRSTANDNIQGTPNPASLAVRTGSTSTVVISFAADDTNLETALAVTSGLNSLPAGWSSPFSNFSCATISMDGVCQFSLTYAPTLATVGASPLTIGFAYTNNAGIQKTGTVTVTYSATTPYLYVADFGGNSVSSCPLNFDNSVGACTASAGFSSPYGIARRGSFAYVTNTNDGSVDLCSLGAGGALGGCTATGSTFSTPGLITIDTAGTYAYLYDSSGLNVCAISPSDGTLSTSCAAASATLQLGGLAFAPDGMHAFAVSEVPSADPMNPTRVVDACTFAADGTVSTCVNSGAIAPTAAAALTIQNGYLYLINSDGSLSSCAAPGGATVGTCTVTAVGTYPNGLAFSGTTGYLSTDQGFILACPVNADGTFGTCVTVNDSTFNGTGGMMVR